MQSMNGNLDISKYLDGVHRDWLGSRDSFPENTVQGPVWPIPFFGNPRTAIVATVGVNPSSEEFETSRRWGNVQKDAQWKQRLRDYFKNEIPAHEWFEPWRIGLALLGVSYEAGTAAHLDVSYRPTIAMFKNPRTNGEEFRRMVVRDVAWFFKLLLLCPNLKLLLTFGPITGNDQKPESLFGFLFAAAPSHDFRVLPDAGAWKLWHEPTGKVFLVHDADTPTEKCVTCRVVKNLHAHREELQQVLGLQ